MSDTDETTGASAAATDETAADPHPVVAGNAETTIDRAEAPVPSTRMHTYPDGSARVGVDPFPELSPLEEEQKRLRDATPPQDAVAVAEAAKEAAILAGKQAAAASGMVTAATVETKPAP